MIRSLSPRCSFFQRRKLGHNKNQVIFPKTSVPSQQPSQACGLSDGCSGLRFGINMAACFIHACTHVPRTRTQTPFLPHRIPSCLDTSGPLRQTGRVPSEDGQLEDTRNTERFGSERQRTAFQPHTRSLGTRPGCPGPGVPSALLQDWVAVRDP